VDKILHIVDNSLEAGDTSSVSRSFRAKPPIGRIDQILHGSRSFLLHVRKDMRIGIQGDGDVGVP